MIITGAFFADAAQVAEGKLFVLGGGWDVIHVPMTAGQITTITVVVLAQFDPADKGEAVLVLRLFTPDQEEVFRIDGAFAADPAREQQFFIVGLNTHFPRTGRHVVTIESTTGSAISLPLTVQEIH